MIYPRAESNLYLTDEHPRSSYGMLVLCDDTDSTGHGYGPADLIYKPGQREVDYFGNLAVALTAADVVAKWAIENVTSEREEQQIRLFLGQWPTGPQLPAREELAEWQRWHTTNRESGDHVSAYDH